MRFTAITSIAIVSFGLFCYPKLSTPANAAIMEFPTTTSLEASPNPGITGTLITLTGTVVAVGTDVVPVGTISFFDGTSDLGDIRMDDGVAVLTTTSLRVGTNSITADYSGGIIGGGDEPGFLFNASTSSPIDVVVVEGITSTPPAATPLPAGLPLFATGLGALGLLGWRRRRKAGASLLGAA